ncbi:hypothetical protein C8J45_101824 [Sphingomonas sp. PP-CE-3G-477]|uniref:hypothetical protein n=1 Tax=Sphingomonas sp. PP-CE-3G-477 TaxID=2135660 RepID=UPI000D4E4FA8|nr:hypothetical protein [Sphingomonas sp. PP-CE-3G-477]PTQ65960.1 hypothetical protein C8J45_101824 [Sphingomonas sp. PP-CE-3G-477]
MMTQPTRLTTRALALAGGTAVLATLLAAPAAAQAARRVTINPYIEASQTLYADLNGGDVLTYTSLAAGVDAAIETQRVSGQLSYRYERRFGWGDDLGDQDIHSGLARVDARVTRNLTLEAAGIATRARSDIRGAAPGLLVGNVDNVSQLYSVFAGPSFTDTFGPVVFNANYRLGYTKVETPTFGDTAVGGRRLDYYDDSIGNTATASATVAPGSIAPFGITLSGAYDRETASQLKQRYEGYYGRGDILQPISPYVALTAGVGYETIETSQKDAVVDATGTPVLDRDGRFITNAASPRRIAYRTDGVYYDAGVIWRPNRRTSVEAHVGKRYGSLSYTGTATYQASQSVGLSVNVYDGVQTFGRQLRTGIGNLPTSFLTGQQQGFGQQFNGCVFGTTGAAPGGCLNDVFQSISTASYRARGVDGVIVATRGRSTFGAGLGYSNRKLYAPNFAPGIVVTGIEDQSYYGQLFYQRSLTQASGVNADLFANYYDPGVANIAPEDVSGDDGVWSYGATGTYYHNFGRLGTTASLGLYSFKVGDFDSEWSAQALIGARYQF